MKTPLTILFLAIVQVCFCQTVQLKSNLNGSAYTIPEFRLVLKEANISLRAHTTITCKTFEVSSDSAHGIKLFGDATVSCDLLELGNKSLKISLAEGLNKASFTIKYKSMRAEQQQDIEAVDGVSLVLVKQ